MNRRPPTFLCVVLLAILLLPACSAATATATATPVATRTPAQTLRIIAGSENQTLEPLLQGPRVEIRIPLDLLSRRESLR